MSIMNLSMIVALNQDNIIGEGGALPWRLSNDMIHFKELTMGKVVIMGRKTYESIPLKFRPLPGRHTIVITHQTEWYEDGVFVVNDPQDALSLARSMTIGLQSNEIMVCGGGEIYELMMPYVDKIYVTEVLVKIVGDNLTYFPSPSVEEWDKGEIEEFFGGIDEKNEYPHMFFTLTRKIKVEGITEIENAMNVIKHAMIADNPSEPGSYAHSWHCNIAMMCYDAIRSNSGDINSENASDIGNDAASRFMKLCFGVETRK